MSSIEQDGKQRSGISFWWYVGAFLLPILGFVAGIYFLAKGKVGPGLGLWGTAILGSIIGFVLLGAASSGIDTERRAATAVQQESRPVKPVEKDTTASRALRSKSPIG